MTDVVLVFPSSVEASVAFIKNAHDWKQRVIGASSLANDPYANNYDAWEKLPYIHEEEFLPQIKRIIQYHGIGKIYTPHAPTYLRLTELMNELPGIQLMGESPYAANMQRVISANDQAAKSLNYMAGLTDQSNKLRQDFLASLLSNAVSLYGECTMEKMAALCAIFCEAPKGDVIEIGSFFGKSVYILNRLAAYFNIGATIAVDPWDMVKSIQKESPATIQSLSAVWDWEVVFQGFLLTMQAVQCSAFNYIRATSVDAHQKYYSAPTVNSPQFGETPLTGKIAILHLDGNHDEEAVAEDLKLWGAHLAPGGWIVFDDYEWSQGDGPRKVADRMAKENAANIERQFIAGGAAFFKMKV